VIDLIREFFLQFGLIGSLAWMLVKILVIMLPVIIAVAFYTLFERKIIGWMHVRQGPQYVGGVFGIGVIQAFADVFKMLFKELITPDKASPFLYRLAPLIALAPALAAWALIPFGENDTGPLVLSDINAGILMLLALTSMGVYGIILGGWASNSKYAVMGALRAASQVISYEIAMGFALVGVLVAAGSMNLTDRQHEPDRNRQCPDRQQRVPGMVLHSAVPAVPGVLHLRYRRNQPRPVRRCRR